MKAPALRLDELQIDGFGHFHEFKIELGPGLNVLYGDNEVGKSTLMAFVRSVLFGFARRNAPERYEPVGGKTFGGRLLMSTPHGDLWVQRLAGRSALGELTVKNGVMAPVPESKLREALGSVDRGLFEQVFAFGLDELRSWSQMMEAGNVNEALAAASMQGAQGLPQALKKFEAEAEQLWGERASKRELNLALQAIASVRARRQLLGDRPREYFAARAEHLATQAEAARLQAELEQAQADEFLLGRLRAAEGHVERALRAERQLAALPSIASFPQGGALRLDEALAALDGARASAARAAAAVTASQKRLDGLNAQLSGRAAAAQISGALETWRAVATLAGELPGRQRDLEQRQSRLGEQLDRLGLGRPVDEVDASSAARARLTGLRTRLGALAEAKARAEESGRIAASRSDAVERELAERTAELGALGGDAPRESFEQALEAARALGNLEHQARVVRAQFEDRQTALAAAEVPDEPAPIEQWPLVWVAPLGLGLLMLAGMTAALAGFGPGALALLAALAIDGLMVAVHRKGHAHWQAQTSAWQAVVRHRQTHRERLSSELGVARSRLTALEQQVAQARATAGVAPDAAHGARLAELERIAGQAGRRSELLRDLALGRARKASATAELATASQALAQAEAGVAAGRAELDGALAQLGLAAGLEVSGALELLAEIALAQSTGRSLQDLGAAVARDVERARAGSQALADAARLAGVEAKGAPGQVAALAAWLEATQGLSAEAAAGNARLEDAGAALAQARAGQGLAEGRVAALLEAAGVEDAEAFRRAAAAFEEGARAAGELQQAAAGVEAACGLPIEEAHAQLLTAPGVATRLEAAQQRRLKLEEARRAAHERTGALGQQLSAWESDAALARLLEEEQTLIARAEALAHRTAVARLAGAVLGQAREKFEAEHQPALIAAAAETFKLLTEGGYLRLTHEVQTGALQVVDRQGRLFSPDQLSRGTREQLLISLRLAMIEQLGRERLALPVLVDDVLVNSDPRRAERMVAVLARLAARHQVIAFTCHPQFRELFKAHGAKAIEVSTRAQLALLPS